MVHGFELLVLIVDLGSIRRAINLIPHPPLPEKENSGEIRQVWHVKHSMLRILLLLHAA